MCQRNACDSQYVCSRTRSGSTSIAVITCSATVAGSVPGKASTRCSSASALGISASGARRTGISRLPSSIARRYSIWHSADADQSGLTQQTTALAASIAVPSSARHGAPGGIASVSTHIVRPRRWATATKASTASASA